MIFILKSQLIDNKERYSLDNNLNRLKLNILFDIERILRNQYDIITGERVDFEGEWADLHYSGFEHNYEVFGRGYNSMIIDESFASEVIKDFDRNELIKLVVESSVVLGREINHDEVATSNKYLLDNFYIVLSNLVIFELMAKVNDGNEITYSNINLVRKSIVDLRAEYKNKKTRAS